MSSEKKTPSKIPMYYRANQNIQEKAKSLRKKETKAEKILWEKLKNKQLEGFKFRRQHPIFTFIADFYCHKANLIIEVDGSIHNLPDVIEKDEGRTFELENLGLFILRFSNDEVLNNIDSVIEKIKNYLLSL
jgi:cyclase